MRERSVYLMFAGGLLVVAALAFFIRPLLVEDKPDAEREARTVDVPDSTPTATVPAEFTIRSADGDAPQPKGSWPAFQKQDGSIYASPDKPEGEAATP